MCYRHVMQPESDGNQQARDLPADLPFGERLRRLRRAAGLTQEELAAAAGVSSRTISDLERGARATPQSGPADLIARALRLTGAEREAWFAAIRAQRLPRTPLPPAPAAPPLPPEPGPLLGRERDLATVEERLASGQRLISLIGPGGVGKTRLAIATARQRAARGDLVIWTGLETLPSADAVLPAIARACGAREGGGPQPIARIAETLAGRDALLVVDNAEHVLEAAPDLAALLQATPGLAMLVTSREELRVRGELVIAVDPLLLPLPHAALATLPENPAVALFLRAIGDARGSAAESDALLREAADVVRLVDGLPLAIELAGAQAAALPPDTIASLLEAAGLSLLERGRRDGPGRFRTMESAIAWSLDLLPPDAERLLRLLGIFRGGFTAEAAASLTDAIGAPELLRLLPALVNAQLIQRQPAGAAARLRLLEPIRMFALQRLRDSDDLAAAREAHAAWFQDWAGRQVPALDGPDPLPALDALERDLPNLHAAIAARIAGEHPAAMLPLLSRLHRFYESRGYRAEHRAMLDAAIAAAGASITPNLIEGVFWSGYHANIMGDQPAATAAISRLREFAAGTGDGQWTARADLLQWGRDAGQPRSSGADLLRHGLAALGPDRGGDVATMLTVLLGVELQESGRAEEALPLLEEACATITAAGRALDLPVPLARLGLALLDLGRDEEALPRFNAALENARKLGLPGIAIFPLLGIARAGAHSADRKRQEDAAAALGAAEEIVRRQGLAWGPYWEAVIGEIEASLASALGPDMLATIRTHGRPVLADDSSGIA